MSDRTKIKFQNPDFRRKLQDARGYKRMQKKIPDTKMGIFLGALGLTSRLVQTALFAVILGLLYFIYAPNLFTVKRIVIAGADNLAKTDIETGVNKFLKSKIFWPQNNLLLLSKNDLKNYLLSHNKFIVDVLAIKKSFPSTLNLEIKQRFSRFLLQSQGNIYILSNDGMVERQLTSGDLNSTSSPYTNLITIDLFEKKEFYENEKLADQKYFQSLDEIIGLARSQINGEITKFEIENLEQSNINAAANAGFLIKLDINADMPNIFNRLKLLLKNLGEDRIKEIKYIDMRIKDRGYVCYKGAKCAQADPAEIEKPATAPQ